MARCTVDVVGGEDPAIVLRGELDVACAHEVQHRLRQLLVETSGPVRIHLEGLTLVDSLGVQALLLVAQEARAHQREVTWSRPSAATAPVLVAAGADQFLTWST